MSKRSSLIATALCLAFVFAVPATAQNTGSVFTGEWTGSAWDVNANTISDPNAVYLSGGPHNQNANGLPLRTVYYYQVTDPSGKTLLSLDDISCRMAQVLPNTNNQGVIFGLPPGAPPCSHPDGLSKSLPVDPNGGDPIQLMPFAPTPNNGGVYKLWIVPVDIYNSQQPPCALQNGTRQGGVEDSGNSCLGSFGFVPGNTKTDNFKIKCDTTSLQASTLASGGTLYAAGDTGTVNGGTATYYVNTVDAGGAVLSYTITATGSGYSLGSATTTAVTGSGTGFTINITAVGGDFCGGTVPQSLISGLKYSDANQNGVLDPSEVGLGNWEIDVITNLGTTLIPTDADGNWAMPLSPGTTFTACEVLTSQAGWFQSGPLSSATIGQTILVVNTGTSLNATYGANCWNGTVPNVDTSGLNFGNYQAQDLTVSKTANPAFTRTYNWSITKDVDKTLVKQVGGTATFNYTVKANETGFTDSAWVVSGTITVSNPNLYFDFTNVNVSDAVNDSADAGICVVANSGVIATVPKNSFATIGYTCTYLHAPSPLSGTNTATADWSSNLIPVTPHTTGTGQATFTFNTPTSTTNKTIHVTDAFNGANPPTALGTLTATDGTPFASGTYTYSHTVNIPTNGCVSYLNTAKITETGQSAGQTVQVCGPVKTGALTMGYWQNKNGQAIITGGAATSGVCNSGTWLRGFAPFQDLSSTANCNAVGTYVTNVIKAATCTSATNTCNLMLKAQDLATSLDVYFSDPALGGNKIGAPAPIGGVAIDLTKICQMIDGSGGTATCGGTYENVSPAFGGASSLTVIQMLTYAGSQSNVGGTTWYGQIKALQVLAKDAFDAINNGVAFAP